MGTGASGEMRASLAPHVSVQHHIPDDEDLQVVESGK